MITKAILSRYVVGDFINFIKNAQTVVSADATATQEVGNFINALKEKQLQLEAAYAFQKDSPESRAIEALDVRRDDAFLGIKTVANAYKLHFEPLKIQAAKVILACIAKYGKNVQSQSITSETTILDRLVQDFETDATLVDAFTTLGINGWVAELKAANVELNNKFMERNRKYALKPAESATELKPLVIKVYEALMVQIDSRNNIDSTGKYTTLVNELNSLITQYNNKVIARESSASSTAAAPKA